MAQALLRLLDNQQASVDGAGTKFERGGMGIFGDGNAIGFGEALKLAIRSGLSIVRNRSQ